MVNDERANRLEAIGIAGLAATRSKPTQSKPVSRLSVLLVFV